MGDEMTEQECLEKCRDMWRWLAEYPKSKNIYFNEHKELLKDRPVHDCYACKYAEEQMCLLDPDGDKSKCEFCLLLDLWGNRDLRYSCCEKLGSPYSEWNEAIDWLNFNGDSSHHEEAIKANATKIADFCEEKLKEMK
jgi:hypothetical protein